MYFGGIKGFNWFQPTSVTDIAAAPQVGIISAQANDEEIKRNTRYFSGSLIELPYDKNDLSFQFAVFDYTRPPANKIRYKLEGWDNRWTTTYGKNIRYSNLPPGSYTLRVRGSNGNDVWGQEKRLSICIAAPFWQTRWFYLAVAVLALFASVMITRMLSNRKIKEKLRALEKQRAIEAERNRISKDMHDEIGSGLTHIALMSDIINSRERSESEIKNGIQTIATSSRKLIQNMSDIVWTLNTENDTLENLLAYIREQSSTWLEPFDITYHIRFPDELPLIHLTNEQRRNLFLVTKEAISNAMKHAAATEIILSFEIVPHQFRFRIIDNGKGFNGKNKKINSNGLNNMKKRMTEIEGTVEIISEENKGTTILYCLCRK
jgi:two-component sensor histidine kinase